MASMSYGQTWFTRKKMAPELEEHVFYTCRNVFFDSNGEDLRMKEPGFNWFYVRDKRREVFQNAEQQLITMFNERYEKITGQEGNRSERKSNDTPILPSMKTPGLSRLRPKVDKSKVDEVVINLAFNSPEQSDSSTANNKSQEVEVGNTVMGKVTDRVDTVDLPNTQQTAQVIGISKSTVKKCSRGRSNSNQIKTLDKEDAGHKNRAESSRDDQNSHPLSDDDFPDPTCTRSTRSTKPNQKKADVATTRVTRSRACKSAIDADREKTKRLTSEKTANQINSPPSTFVHSSTVGVDSDETLVVMKNDLFRKLSTSCRRSSGVCQVAIEKIHVCLPAPEAIDVQKSAKGQKDTCLGESNPDNNLETVTGQIEIPTSMVFDMDNDTEVPLAKPTPPRRKALRLKRKGGKGNGKARVNNKTKSRVDVLKEHLEVPVVKKASSSNTKTTELSSPTLTVAMTASPTHHHITTVATSSNPSSDNALVPLKIQPMGTPLQVKFVATPSLQNKVTSFPSDDSVYQSFTSNVEPVATPSLQKEVTPLPSDDSVYESCLSCVRTPSLPENSSTGDTDLNSLSSESKNNPVDVSYLTQIPRTIQKLQEEHRFRSGGKLVSLSQLLNSGGRNSPSFKKTSKIAKEPHPPAMGTQTPRSTLFGNSVTKIPKPSGGKRLRSLSLENLRDFDELKENRKKSRSDTSSSDTTEENSSDAQQCGARMEHASSFESTSSPDSVYPDAPCKSSSKAVSHFYNVLMKNPAGHSKGSSGEDSSSGQSLSFIPHKIPKKAENFEARQECLADKVRQKNEEEEKRKQEIKALKRIEIMEKTKKREERVKRVAERQAALKRKDEEKKMKIKGRQDKNQVLIVNQKKAKEVEEKNKKLKERMMAAEVKRKQEQAHQKKRLKQLEEERKMASELAIKRREFEEEEKKLKRQEKHQLEKERHFKREEEIKGKQKQLVDKQKQQQNESKKVPTETPSINQIDLKKQFEQLLGGAMAKVPVVATPRPYHSNHLVTKERTVVEEENENSTEKTNTDEYMNAFFGRLPTNKLSSAESRLNATFTKESEPVTVVQTPARKIVPPMSYEMTPAENDPLHAYENYDIGNLSSEDSTDDDDCPKKVLPLWAMPNSLNTFMLSQEDDLSRNRLDIMKIFPPEQLLKDPDLNRIFKYKRQRFIQRTSSAQWHSPMIKRNRLV